MTPAIRLVWPLPLLAISLLDLHNPILTGVAVVLAFLPVVRPASGPSLRHPLFMLGLALFLISALVGTWAAYDPALNWPSLMTLLGSVSLFFALVNSGIRLRAIAGGLVGVAILLALYFVSQYGHLDYSNETGPLANLGRITGSILPAFTVFKPHPNAVATFLEGSLLLSLALVGLTHRRQRFLAWGLATAIIAYALLITGSRGAWLGLLVALALWAGLRFPYRRRNLAIIGLSAVAGILFGGYLFGQLALPGQQIAIPGSVLDTIQSRTILYRNSVNLLGDYPFTGIGLGDTFAMVYSRYQLLIPVPYLYYAHNLFLSIGLGLGLLGLVATIWLLILFYNFVVRVERNELSDRRLPLFRAAWLGVTATLIHGLLDSSQFSGDRWTLPMLFALAGLAVAAGRPALEQAEQRYKPRRQWVWLLVGTELVLITAALLFWRPLLGAWYANIGAVYQTRAELSPYLDDASREQSVVQAVRYYERALNVHRSQPVANRRFGMMALDRQQFETAAMYLKRAYDQEPTNQATLKALGYAYLWTGHLDSAEKLFRQLNNPDRLVEELNYWQWWWRTHDQPELSLHANKMGQWLSPDESVKLNQEK